MTVSRAAAAAAAPVAGLAASPPGPGIGRAAAQRLARAELSKPMYHPQPSLTQRIVDFLNRLLNQAGNTGLHGWWALAVLATVAALLVIGILAGTQVYRRSRRLAPPPALAAATRSARDHYQAAQRLAAAGDHGAACLECVRAIAADLEEREVLLPRPGRTADELAAEAGQALPAEAAALRAAAAVFDAICYGKRPGTAAGYQHIAALAARIRAGTGRSRLVAAQGPAPAGTAS